MRVPDSIRKCVGFIYCNEARGFRPIGTAFFVAEAITVQPWHLGYTVTAKHLIAYIRQNSVDQVVHIRVNLRGSGTAVMEIPADAWWSHPADSSVDIAVHPEGPHWSFDFHSYPLVTGNAETSSIVTPEVIEQQQISVGEEVFISGLFVTHAGQDKNIPIIRVGNIAAMPEEKVNVPHFGPIDAYLIEARSIGGISGSPAFVHLGEVRLVRSGYITYEPRHAKEPGGIYYLLGLVHGHFDVKETTPPLTNEKVNMGIAIVVPASKIVETISHLELIEMKKKRIKKFTPESEASADVASDSLTAEKFEDVLKRVSQKIDPSGQEKKKT